MGHRLDLAVEIAALPDDGVGIAVGFDIGGFEHVVEDAEQVAAVGFRAGDVHQVDHFNLLFAGVIGNDRAARRPGKSGTFMPPKRGYVKGEGIRSSLSPSGPEPGIGRWRCRP